MNPQATAGTGGKRGRPLDADRTPTILDAVLELLSEGGYDHLRVQDVADRAGVGLGTIYRRWPTKQALVIEALQCGRVADEKVVDTGHPRADLLATFTNLARGMAEKGDIAGFIASLRNEPEIAEIWRCTAVTGMRERLRALIAAARGCDVHDASLDTLTDLGPALILFRITVAGECSDLDALAREVTDLVLAGV